MGEQLDLLISCAAASRAKTLALPETEVGSLASGADCGSKCDESCARCGRLGSLLKTSLLSALTERMLCSATWKGLTTPAGRSWWVLTTSARRTDASACGSLPAAWPTPTAGDAKASGSRTAEGSAAHPGISLTDAAVHGLTIKHTAARK